MPGMPYHLEKGPWLSVLEDYLNGEPGRAADALVQLREARARGTSLTQLPFLATRALDGDPDYATLDARQGHLRRDWFGTDGPATFMEALMADLPPALADELQARGVSAPKDAARADVVTTFANEVLAVGGPDVPPWPATGFWFQYYGDVEGIVRETLVRTIEVALGVDHDEELPADGPTRALPIELFWKCPQRWFEGWVTWRWDERHGTGQVTAVLATPGSGKPVLENPGMGEGALEATTTHATPPPEMPWSAPPSDPARNPQQSAKGMWVITHAEHAQLPTRAADVGTGSGDWRVPAFGPTYVGLGPIVCVQPSEADGGVRPFGRSFVDLTPTAN
jgi:hypothetical protein